MLKDVFLFLIAMVATILTFACALSCLHQDLEQYQNIPQASVAFWELTMGLTGEPAYKNLQEDIVILASGYLYLIITVIFLVNMLIAQLRCSYGSTYLVAAFDATARHTNLPKLRLVRTACRTTCCSARLRHMRVKSINPS